MYPKNVCAVCMCGYTGLWVRGPLLNTCNYIPNSASPFTVSCNKGSKPFSNLLFLLQTRYCPEPLLKEPDERSHRGYGFHFCNGKKSFVKLCSFLRQQTAVPGADESAGCGSPQHAGLGAGGVGVPGGVSTAAPPGLSPPGGGLCQKHCSTGGGKPHPGSRAPQGWRCSQSRSCNSRGKSANSGQ